MGDRRYFAGPWHERLLAELASLARWPAYAVDAEAVEALASMGLVYAAGPRWYLTMLGVIVLRSTVELPPEWRHPRTIDIAIDRGLVPHG